MPSPGGWDQPQPNGIPQNVQNSFSSLNKWINRQWDPWTPTLTATTTPPTLGTGGSVTGRFLQEGKTVKGRVYVKFGTAGTAAGNGTYEISVPVAAQAIMTAAATHGDPVGGGWLLGGLAMEHCLVTLYSPTVFRLKPSSAYLGFVTHNVPYAWAANMAIAFNFQYDAAA